MINMLEPKKDNKDPDEKKPIIIRNSTDLQRLKLEKLMQNPDKPVIIPEKAKERGVPSVPDFVRNVMGSSAGAGSGEFHVYRHLRRKEYARQKYMKEKAEKEKLEEDYHKKLEENRRLADERTTKKRMKRLKKKQKQKLKSKKPKVNKKSSSSSSEESEVSDDEKKRHLDSEQNTRSESAEDTEGETNSADNNQKTINENLTISDKSEADDSDNIQLKSSDLKKIE